MILESWEKSKMERGNMESNANTRPQTGSNARLSRKTHAIGARLGALVFLGGLSVFAQDPATLQLSAILRDFVSTNNSPGVTPAHPHFNNCSSIGLTTGMVQNRINVNAAGDTTLGDNRNPVASGTTAGCLAPVNRFSEWYNDMGPAINRKFKLDLTFTRVANGNAPPTYVYSNTNFFPFNAAGVTKFNATDPDPFNDTFSSQSNRNYGFTLEFHTQFTYYRGQGQTFNFRGDDDVWVFVNDSLVIDLGGIHGAEQQQFDLDRVQANGRTLAENLGMVDQGTYPLDFFFAERLLTQSNLIITTTLKLVQNPQPLSPPIANPTGRSFASQIQVALSHPLLTTGNDSVKIHYTLDGSTPTAASPVYNPATPFNFQASDTLKAIAIHSNTRLYLPSAVITEIYTKQFTASTLEILDANGLPFPNNYITERATGYTVRLTTTQAGLTNVTVLARTKTNLDSANVPITNVVNQGTNFVYTVVVPFSIAAANKADLSTQAQAYDSLIVSWINPRDPASDRPEAKLLVRPAPVQAEIRFTTDAAGTITTTSYAGTEGTIYVYVTNQQLPVGTPARLTLKTSASGAARDSLLTPLTYLGNGQYRATITTQIDGPINTTTRSDNLLQVSVGWQIDAFFVDPLDGDQATAPAGFGIPAVIAGRLIFTDSAGTPWVETADYNPASGRIYIRFEDDWAGGAANLSTKTATLVIANLAGAAPGDNESVVLTRIDTSKSGDRVAYKGSIALVNLPGPTPNNDTVDVYWRGVVTATVREHESNGDPSRNVTANLKVANPNSTSVITVTDPDNDSLPISRSTKGLEIVIRDESKSSTVDTIIAEVSCVNSGDKVSNVRLIETSPGSGVYTAATIPKNEGAATPDNILSCASNDVVKVTYNDVVHTTDRNEVTYPITDPTVGTLRFTRVGSDQSVTSVVEESDSGFVIIIAGKTPRIDSVDQIPVTLTAPNDESETFTATETGPATGQFRVTVPFRFVVGTGNSANNKIIEGVLNSSSTDLRVPVQVSAKTENNDVSGTITLIAALNKPSSAYIADANKDGKGDRVVITFPAVLVKLPESVNVHWNQAISPAVTVTGNKISFLPGSNNRSIVLDLSDRPYADTLSGAGVGPFAQMPNNSLFGNSTVAIADSIPPTLLKAEKKPVDLLVVKKGDESYNVDTLFVTVSEPLSTNSVTTDMFKYSVDCGEYSAANPMQILAVPTVKANSDGRTYVVLVDHSKIPMVNSCIYLNRDNPKPVTDVANNLAIGKIKITGDDGDRLISGLRGFPPVSGLDPNDPSWQVAINDTRDSTDGSKGYATPATGSTNPAVKSELKWIPPPDIGAILSGSPALPKNINDISLDGSTTVEERARPQPVPGTRANPDGAINGISGQVTVPISIAQVVVTSRYVATIAIFDHLGNFVRKLEQSFGYQGEMSNGSRVVDGGFASYLIWDQKDKNGRMVGQGVYIWKMNFRFAGGRQEVRFLRTGIMRKQ